VPAPDEASRLTYGGQALLEGVMMRGRDAWAVAVRRPDGGIHTESHAIDSVVRRAPILRAPFLRGVIALGQSLAIGFRALAISARVAGAEEGEEELGSWQVALSMGLAVVLFIGIFIVTPAAAFRWVATRMDSAVLVNTLEGFARVGLFIAYISILGRSRDVRRTFEYHGAEHQTIAAHEHGDPLDAEHVGRYPTLHVRCGTNFLILVMIVTIIVFAAFGDPGIWWRIGSRVIAIPLIAGIAFELLRIGARFPESRLVRAIMLPGLWLQRITTRPPAPDQVEVAIAAFRTLLDHEARTAAGESPATA
jgi:uncharacterized protein YqhQ